MSDKVVKHFKKSDPVLFNIIQKAGLVEIKGSDAYFQNLCRSICSQQLSTKVAAVIFERFKNLFETHPVSAKQVLMVKDEQLRSIGLSRSKVLYIKDLAQKVELKQIVLDDLKNLTDDEVIKQLTQVKGIGVWTVEMFLMFTLGRKDVFSYGDYGLKKAIQNLYGFENLPTKVQMEPIVAKWVPYRTYAARLLWLSLDSKF